MPGRWLCRGSSSPVVGGSLGGRRPGRAAAASYGGHGGCWPCRAVSGDALTGQLSVIARRDTTHHAGRGRGSRRAWRLTTSGARRQMVSQLRRSRSPPGRGGQDRARTDVTVKQSRGGSARYRGRMRSGPQRTGQRKLNFSSKK